MYLDPKFNDGGEIEHRAAIGQVKLRFDGLHFDYFFSLVGHPIPGGQLVLTVLLEGVDEEGSDDGLLPHNPSTIAAIIYFRWHQ